MTELTPLQQWLMKVGAVVMLIGAATYIIWPVAATVMFVTGTLIFTPIQMLCRYEGNDFVIRRLRRQQLLGDIALLVAAALMTMQTWNLGPARRNEWVVALSIAAVLQLYTAIRIPAELNKKKTEPL